MGDPLTLIILAVVLATQVYLVLSLRQWQQETRTGLNRDDSASRQLQQQLQQQNEQLRTALLGELSLNRVEQQKLLQGTMQAMGEALGSQQQLVGQSQDRHLLELTQQLSARQEILQQTLVDLLQQMSSNQGESLRFASASQEKNLQEFNLQLGARHESLQGTTTTLLKQMEERLQANSMQNMQNLEQIRQTVERRLSALQEENNQKLEQMRATVDEKLQKTLEERIGQSFRIVSERLEQVYKGLGEMQTLATGVGDLKRVLSNVRTRGILGEIQLNAILEQILTPEQYYKNIATRPGSSQVVEFAIRLPGDERGEVLLPIDAKFPADAYGRLMEAYEGGNMTEVESAATQLERTIKGFARDIRDKYIEPPSTTDFAIMFLPFEGLYAEVVRRGLLEALQREYRVTIAGPTTMAALLNSLQMGFQTLAIQKRSGEVWRVLGAVKTEFGRFGDVLQAAQRRLEQTNKELENLVGVRTRQIVRRLSTVTALPEEEGSLLLETPEEPEY
ncbi:MAG: DNA recombination protein RmuC [Symbiobacteriaceae bacterium]|nr:DNA recombination protein RmuC [Symbiobacteriaceae bacterium]